MKRLALAAVVAGVLASPAAAANCAKDYKDFWDKIDREKFSKMSGEQVAKLNRVALRGYDACTAGDQKFDSSDFFKKLDREAYNVSDDFWQKLERERYLKK
jgi:opacity protein-like surface antigen